MLTSSSNSPNRERTSDSDLPTPISPPSSSSWLEYFERDDITYSFTSTWSSNYTMSNLPGPGRLLGNLYSRAGSSLERSLRKLANQTGLGGYAKAKDVMTRSCFVIVNSRPVEDPREVEKACDNILRYAGCVFFVASIFLTERTTLKKKSL